MAPGKINVKDRFNENDGEIDLSMSDLVDVPVKEIATFKKAFSLDLSNNRIQVLPTNFILLKHITKLDLSKNEIVQLPEEFGELSKLRHLDLYRNKLQHLPLSFGQLKDLKWLDLKDNELVPAIAKVAGPCIDTKQCQLCAKNVVSFYARLQKQVTAEKESREQQRQKQFQINQKKIQEEKRTKRKEKTKQKKAEQVNVETSPAKVIPAKTNKETNNKSKTTTKSKPSSFLTTLFLTLVVNILLLFILTSTKVQYTDKIVVVIQNFYSELVKKMPPTFQQHGIYVGHVVNDLHEKTGNLTLDCLSYFSNNDDVKNLFKTVNNLFHKALSELKKMYGSSEQTK